MSPKLLHPTLLVERDPEVDDATDRASGTFDVEEPRTRDDLFVFTSLLHRGPANSQAA